MPEFEDQFLAAEKRGRPVPNFVQTMARRPDIVRAHQALRRVVMGPGLVPSDFKALVAQASSMSSGCNYCTAHTANFALEDSVSEEKIAAVYNYETSPYFNEAERIALRIATKASVTPNSVTDSDFAEFRAHWSDDQVVEILSVIGVFGYFNRINDTLATELEAVPACTAQRTLSAGGWTAGKHAQTNVETSDLPSDVRVE